MQINQDLQIDFASTIASCRTKINSCAFGGEGEIRLYLQTETHLGQHMLRLLKDGHWTITYIPPKGFAPCHECKENMPCESSRYDPKIPGSIKCRAALAQEFLAKELNATECL